MADRVRARSRYPPANSIAFFSVDAAPRTIAISRVSPGSSSMVHCSAGSGRNQNAVQELQGPGPRRKRKDHRAQDTRGVETGSRLRIAGEGEAGVAGGPSGDLFVVLHVADHDNFEWQGANLYSAIPITFAQAALGADVKVRTLDGEEDLKIPAGTQTGTIFRVKGHGMPNLGSRGKGDLFVAATLVTPKTLTKDQRKAPRTARRDRRYRFHRRIVPRQGPKHLWVE